MNPQVNSQLKDLKAITIAIFLVFSILICKGQSDEKKSALYPTFGFGFGFFYPDDVNEYIADAYSSYSILYGTTDIFMFLEGHAGLTYKTRPIDISGILEYAIAPKLAIEDGPSFNYTRFSPGIIVNYNIPIGSGRHTFFIGGGPQYHIMNFEEFNAGNIGFKVQTGMSLMFGKFNIQPFLAFSYAKATDKTTTGQDFELNYTNGQLGFNFSFHSPVANK